MNTILTCCPKCSVLQLADGKLTGKKVRCASCNHDFSCKKEAGPIKWVRKIAENLGGEGFEKAVTKVIFTYGIAVPVANQATFISHIGSAVDFGMRRDVKIRIDDDLFNVKISYFRNRRGEPSLHFLWKAGEAIGLKLKERLSRAYRHFIIDKSTDFLTNESVVLVPSSRIGEYVLRVKTSSDTGLINDDTPILTGKRKGGNVLEDKDVSDLLSELKI